MKRIAALLVLPLLVACASTPSAEVPAPATDRATPAPEAPPAEPTVDDAFLAAPTTLADIPVRFATTCPVRPFKLETPAEVTLGEHRFVVEGSTLRRQGGPWRGPLVIGVLGALKDASPGTKKNVDKAARAFKKAGVHLVVANGDLGEDAELGDVMDMLGERFEVPVLVHAGNMEWIAAFTEAFVDASARHPHLINGNWARHLDLGGVHLLTLPGWSNHRFTRSGACRYGKDDVDDVREMAAPLVERGDVVIVVGHGPPRAQGKRAIDKTHDAGNVGDVDLAAALEEVPVRFGIFSHILEAGGRAARSLDAKGVLRVPVKKPQARLYVNAGSASAFPWEMLGGRASEGMAMVFRVHKGKATARKIKL